MGEHVFVLGSAGPSTNTAPHSRSLFVVAHFSPQVGAATPTHTPAGRGYNTSLSYFGHGNYQYGMIEWGQGGGGNAGRVTPPDPNDPEFYKDLWEGSREGGHASGWPAAAQANRSRDHGIYEEKIFGERLADIVTNHDVTKPLFLSYHARIAHYPIQAPIAYQQRPNIAKIDVPHRLVYHAQVEYLDEQLGNLTRLFKDRGMWDNTLMILTSDNGERMPQPPLASHHSPLTGPVLPL